jgi:hypothetical protein
VAFETGYGQQPYHGLIAPMQEAGMMEARRRALINRRRKAQLSIIDPGAPHSEDAFHGRYEEKRLIMHLLPLVYFSTFGCPSRLDDAARSTLKLCE